MVNKDIHNRPIYVQVNGCYCDSSGETFESTNGKVD